MSVAKVVEISSSSKESFEDAIVTGVKRASKTIEGIQGGWVKEMKFKVKNGKVSSYRVNMKLTFVVTE
ncbi:MAG: dodecin domain-containing protein [Acidobacteriota bacterium]|nr:MAG: dodecin domain-containing protein [Acidobacteriota bacterium]